MSALKEAEIAFIFECAIRDRASYAEGHERGSKDEVRALRSITHLHQLRVKVKREAKRAIELEKLAKTLFEALRNHDQVSSNMEAANQKTSAIRAYEETKL